MQIWLAVYLPDLPLEAAWPAASRSTLPPALAVQQHGRIVQATAVARQQGVLPGLRVAAAQAILPTLLIAERRVAREQEQQQAVALCLQAYSSQVAMPAAQWVVAEVGASLRLFGGPLALCQRLRRSLASQALAWRWGLAPAPKGACLLAQGSPARQRRALKAVSLQRRLDALPWQLLGATQAHAQWLQTLGLRSLGDLRRLPRTQLQIRTRTELIQALDQAYGQQVWPLRWWQAPDRFSQRYELDAELEHSHELLQPARELIQQLAGWLRSRNQALAQVELQLLHESSRHAVPSTVVVLAVSQATAQAQPWLRVLAEQLPRQELPAPVRALCLQAGPAQQQPTVSQDLFLDSGQEALLPLLDLMRARLGPQAILQASARAEFLPERANHWEPAKAGLSPLAQTAPLVAHRSQRASSGTTPGQSETSGAGLSPIAQDFTQARHLSVLWPRPVWLLETPQPLAVLQGRPSWQGRLLYLRAGPERLETAWWQGGIQARDYFVADDGHGACCWIYRLRDQASVSQLPLLQDTQWWLHGWFG